MILSTSLCLWGWGSMGYTPDRVVGRIQTECVRNGLGMGGAQQGAAGKMVKFILRLFTLRILS